jgi:flagellar biosynthesis/type III secretory pathway protein FliH
MVRQAKYMGLFLLTFFFAAAPVVVSQDRVIYGGSMDAREHGYQHGYRDGLRQGRADLQSNASLSFESDDYRRADLGYEEYMGPRPDFQRGYRDGFRAGYEDGYKNRTLRSEVYGLREPYDPDRVPRNDEDARYYPNWGYADVAFDTGYRDGLSAGGNDFRERKDYRPEKHDSYEDGDHGYRKSYGTKEHYKEQYRKGFLRGYEDAFNRRGH